MTTNQTIDGVPRYLLEKLWRSCNGMLWNSVADEIRTLLEAGVCMHDWFKSEINSIPDYCTLCGIEKLAAQPQGEPVAHCLLRRNGSGEWVNDAKSWVDGAPSREIIAECEKHPELYRVRLAYAEPPAPVAVALPERLLGDDGVCTESHYASGWNTCIDELKRLNPSL